MIPIKERVKAFSGYCVCPTIKDNSTKDASAQDTVVSIADFKRILEIVENCSKQYMPSDKYSEMMDNIEVLLNT